MPLQLRSDTTAKKGRGFERQMKKSFSRKTIERRGILSVTSPRHSQSTERG